MVYPDTQNIVKLKAVTTNVKQTKIVLVQGSNPGTEMVHFVVGGCCDDYPFQFL